MAGEMEEASVAAGLPIGELPTAPPVDGRSDAEKERDERRRVKKASKGTKVVHVEFVIDEENALGFQLGEVGGGKVAISSLVEGGQAFKLGVVVGSVLLAVNGQPTIGLSKRELAAILDGPGPMVLRLQLPGKGKPKTEFTLSPTMSTIAEAQGGTGGQREEGQRGERREGQRGERSQGQRGEAQRGEEGQRGEISRLREVSIDAFFATPDNSERTTP